MFYIVCNISILFHNGCLEYRLHKSICSILFATIGICSIYCLQFSNIFHIVGNIEYVQTRNIGPRTTLDLEHTVT